MMQPLSPAAGPLPLSWQLLEMRARLRLIDTQLIVLLARRCELQRDIRRWKQDRKLPLHDPGREADVLAHCTELARSLHVPVELVHALYVSLFELARGSVPARQEPESCLTGIKEEEAPCGQNARQAPGLSGDNS